MVINKRYVLAGFIWLCMSHVFSQEDIKTINGRLEPSISNNSTTDSSRAKIIFQPKLRLDSYVSKLKPDTEKPGGIDVIGNFAYEIDSKFIQGQSDTVLMNQIEESYKLVEMPNSQYFISNGNIIVVFKENTASKILEQELGLQSIKQFYEINMVVYRANSFPEIEGLVDLISARPEVAYVELDLINPYLN